MLLYRAVTRNEQICVRDLSLSCLVLNSHQQCELRSRAYSIISHWQEPECSYENESHIKQITCYGNVVCNL